jgi:AraC-like DNA-binding protein
MIVGQDSAEQLLARAQITAAGPEIQEAFLPTVTFVGLCLEHVRTARSEALAHSPFAVPFGTFSLLIAAVAQGTDFGDALRRCTDAMKILRPDLTVAVSRGRNALRLSIAYRHPATADVELGIEFFALALHSAFRWITGERLRPLQVRAPAAQEGHEQSMLTVLCCPLVRRDTGVVVHYALDDTARHVRALKYENWGAHELPEFLRLLQEAADEINLGRLQPQMPIVDRVSQLVAQGVRGERVVADQLGMSSASLRRHIAESGTTYRAILSQVQRDLVSSLLITEKSLDGIAVEAGFSDARSLRRACLRWFGVPPAEYRNAQARKD